MPEIAKRVAKVAAFGARIAVRVAKVADLQVKLAGACRRGRYTVNEVAELKREVAESAAEVEASPPTIISDSASRSSISLLSA